MGVATLFPSLIGDLGRHDQTTDRNSVFHGNACCGGEGILQLMISIVLAA